ncbi:MAG TPA: VanZ family protein [Polyangiaceae bacterium]|jgi:VanZ family protein|nr:VanZ family protein [Polyangiaceae bacterium]
MKLVKYVGPLVAYALYIFVAGSLKDSSPPDGMSDKTAHAIAFGFMVLPALLALHYLAPRLGSPSRIAAAVGTASALGALLEFWQLLLPWRSSELLDWVADTVGAIGVGIALLALSTLLTRRMRET